MIDQSAPERWKLTQMYSPSYVVKESPQEGRGEKKLGINHFPFCPAQELSGWIEVQANHKCIEDNPLFLSPLPLGN